VLFRSVPEELQLVLRAEFPQAPRVIPEMRGLHVSVSTRWFHGLRVMPGDVLKSEDGIMTVLGAMGRTDIWCCDGSNRVFMLQPQAVLDTSCISIVDCVHARVISSRTS
jgi:hypothetical protein